MPRSAWPTVVQNPGCFSSEPAGDTSPARTSRDSLMRKMLSRPASLEGRFGERADSVGEIPYCLLVKEEPVSRREPAVPNYGESLLHAFATNERINQFLLENLDEAAWRADPPGGRG